jgi:hypothetical protein
MNLPMVVKMIIEASMKKKMETMLLLMNKVKPIEDMDQQYQ